MEPGRLEDTAILYEATTAADGDGTYTTTNVNHGTRRVYVRAIRGTELMEAQQVVADTTHRATMRWDSLTETIVPQSWYFTVGTTTYEILSAIKLKRDRVPWLEMQCKVRM